MARASRLAPRLRRLWLGLSTVLGIAKRGYFIPYRYAAGIPKSAERAGFPWLEQLFSGRQADFLSLLDDDALIADIARRFDGATPPQPRWQQSWFPRLDGLAAYLMVRKYRPKRIIEVGSGHSTRFIAAAVADGGLDTDIQAIDPAPRADIAGIARVRVHQMTLQDAPLSLFDTLQPGDFLMIDSSHIAVPGSDVDLLMGRIVPALPVGCFVQIHDIFLPDAYPEAWDWRGYSEQLPVATLIAGGGFTPVWSSHWIATRCPVRLTTAPLSDIPIKPGIPESAIWLKRTA